MDKQFQIFDGSEGLVYTANVTDNGDHYGVNLGLTKELNVRSVTSGWVVASAKWHYSGQNKNYGMSTEVDGEQVQVSGTQWSFGVRKTHPIGWYDAQQQGLLAASGAKVDIKMGRDLWLVIVDPIANFILQPSAPATRFSKKGTTADLRLWNTPEGLAWQLDVSEVGKKVRGVRLEFLRGIGLGDPTQDDLATLTEPGSAAGTIRPYAPDHPYVVFARQDINPYNLVGSVPHQQAAKGWILCDPGPPPPEGEGGVNVGKEGYKFQIVIDRVRRRDIRQSVPVAPVYSP